MNPAVPYADAMGALDMALSCVMDSSDPPEAPGAMAVSRRA